MTALIGLSLRNRFLVRLIRKLIITVRSLILTTGVSNEYFRAIDSRWGPFTVDCFASCANTKLPRFYSRFYSPNTLGVNALSHSWQGENCWLIPPVCLVTQVIEHVKLRKCVGALVVPYWPSAIFGHGLLMKIVLSVVTLLTSFMLLKGSEFLRMVLIRIVFLYLINLVRLSF